MAGGAPTALARCVGDVEAFLVDTWTRRAHLHRAGPGAFDDLLDLDDVDAILTTTGPRPPTFRLVRGGGTLARSRYTRTGTVGGQRVSDLPDVGRVLRLFEEGATIVLQGLHRYWAPLARFCRDLELDLTQPVQANAYLTPPGSAGLDVHHDTHDVFALQTHGTKHWVTYEPDVHDPLPGQRWSSDEHEPGARTLDVELRPGDALYVPRGTPHAAETRDTTSLHITIGIRSATWHDLLGDALDLAAEEPAFRAALPVGYADRPEAFADEVAAQLESAAKWLRSLDPRELADRAAQRFRSSRVPLLEGQLRQLVELDAIDDSTTVLRRPGTVASVDVVDGRARLRLGDREVRMPEELAPVLREIVERRRFQVGDLRDLDGEGRLVLVRRLIREGLLVTEG